MWHEHVTEKVGSVFTLPTDKSIFKINLHFLLDKMGSVAYNIDRKGTAISGYALTGKLLVNRRS